MGLQHDASSRREVFDDDLGQTDVGHLELILVDRATEAAVKQLHSAAQGALQIAARMKTDHLMHNKLTLTVLNVYLHNEILEQGPNLKIINTEV